MLSHEIVRAIEQDRQRGVEATLGRVRLEHVGPGRRARMRAALLRWLGAVPAAPGERPAAAARQPVTRRCGHREPDSRHDT